MKKCTICKKLFESERAVQICSPECFITRRTLYARRYKPRKSKKICRFCKKEFTPLGKKVYCSPECTSNGCLIYFQEYRKKHDAAGKISSTQKISQTKKK